MKIYTAIWNENGKAGQKSFARYNAAQEFACGKVKGEDCSPVAVWEYVTGLAGTEVLAMAHDRATWWDIKKYRGTALKNGSWTTR